MGTLNVCKVGRLERWERKKRLAKDSPTLSAQTAERMGDPKTSQRIKGRPPAQADLVLVASLEEGLRFLPDCGVSTICIP